LVHLDVGVEDGDLAGGGSVNGGLGLSDDNHTLDDFGVLDTTTKNLLDSNVIGGEFTGRGGDSMLASTGDQASEEVFETVLLGSNGSFHASEDLIVVSDVLDLVASCFVKELHGVFRSLLITDKDVRWMKTHLQ